MCVYLYFWSPLASLAIASPRGQRFGSGHKLTVAMALLQVDILHMIVLTWEVPDFLSFR